MRVAVTYFDYTGLETGNMSLIRLFGESIVLVVSHVPTKADPLHFGV